jgi:hypothetical protein
MVVSKPACAQAALLGIFLLAATAKAEPLGSTGVVFFPEAALTNIEKNTQIVPILKTWIDHEFAAAQAARNEPPKPLRSLDIADNLHSRDAEAITKDFDRLLSLALDYRLNKQEASLTAAEGYLTAWASTYIPIGHPNVESPFTIFVMSYELIRDAVSPSTRAAADAFLSALYDTQVTHLNDKKFNIGEYENKWSLHCFNTAAIAFLRKDSAEIGYVRNFYVDQLNHNILPSGKLKDLLPIAAGRYPEIANREYDRGVTLDFIHRDAVEYHISSILYLFGAALIAENNGLDWFALTGKQGQKLEWAFDFLIPYATGEKKHQEFGGTLLSWDRGKGREKPFKPADAIRALTLATKISKKYQRYADPSTLRTPEIYAIYAGF